MKTLFHIVYYKIITFLKSNTELSFRAIIKSTAAVIVFSGFAYGAYLLTGGVLTFLIERGNVGLFLSHRFIAIILFILFLSVNAGNIVVSYSTLYKSREIKYLITKPVSFVQLFIVKFLDNFLYSSTTLFLLMFAVTAGYITYFKLDAIYFLVIPLLIILPFMLTAAALGSMILLLLIRLSIKIGLRVVIAILASVYIISIFTFFKLTSPMQLVNMVMQYFPEVDRYFGFFENPILHYLPSHWAAEALYWISRGMPEVAAYYIFIQLIVCIAFFVLATLLAKLIYKKTFFEFGQPGKQKEATVKSNSIFSFEKVSRFNSKTESLIKKEFWTFFREPGQWIHFSVMIFLLIIFTVSVGSIKRIEINDVRIQTIVFLTIFLFNSFLIASLSLRFVFPLLSLEGEVFWKILTSPVEYKNYLFTRFALLFIIILIISVLLNIFSTRFYPAIITYISVLLSFLVTLCLTSINFGMGNIFVNFKENNPIRISSSHGAVISFLICLIYLVTLIIILFNPAYTFFDSIRKGLQPEVNYFLVPVIIIAVVSAILSYVFLSFGANRKET